MTTEQILIAALPFLGGWVWRTEARITRQDAVIVKIDRLVDVLLEDRLAQSQKGSVAQDSSNRSGGGQR